ncbi:unnamed protein product [Euphydryas editha]|uniref:Nose resistant-to-fluoxetine protein N-terminal domain-containing protein n=1 Tax=Euphydryas editha TaxID=104508 RepID=A0AAU9UM23_EUPED|nr:unnamed protein product [Euphydryas editha]
MMIVIKHGSNFTRHQKASFPYALRKEGLQVEDASGRYTSMFYWGNNYWTGSAELCSILNEQHAPSKSNNREYKFVVISPVA